jgi:hypothetical protein
MALQQKNAPLLLLLCASTLKTDAFMYSDLDFILRHRIVL